MHTYILRRVILMVPTLFLVAVAIFVLTHLMPGDVVMIQLEGAASYSPEDYDRLRAELGLDKPYFGQMADWLWGLARLDMGNSLWNNRPVVSEILQRLPVTIQLALMAFGISSVMGITFGVLAAIRQDSWFDQAARVFAVGGLSMPDFWVGTLIILIPLIWFGFGFATTYTPPWEDFTNNMRLMLPAAAAIGVRSSAGVMRLTRTTLLEVLRQDYVRTAHAKGLRERVVVYRHALRNSLIPVITMIGLTIPHMVSGNVVMEQIFTLPGIGRYLIEAIETRDYSIIIAVNLVFAGSIMFMNLLTDLSYGWLDPRIRYK